MSEAVWDSISSLGEAWREQSKDRRIQTKGVRELGDESSSLRQRQLEDRQRKGAPAQRIDHRKALRASQRRYRKLTASTQSVEDVLYFDVGEMNVECLKCSALHFIGERKVGSSESVLLLLLWEWKADWRRIRLQEYPPALLKQLLTVNTSRDKQIRNSIDKYNNALCMALMHAKWVSRG